MLQRPCNSLYLTLITKTCEQ
uniref:Uncharacterized protein n=1 Tax=Anguilla anguilla TaxID=7936 RepID=A0A0E9UDQ1_ANGAN